jgi:hypothetical protein
MEVSNFVCLGKGIHKMMGTLGERGGGGTGNIYNITYVFNDDLIISLVGDLFLSIF